MPTLPGTWAWSEFKLFINGIISYLFLFLAPFPHHGILRVITCCHVQQAARSFLLSYSSLYVVCLDSTYDWVCDQLPLSHVRWTASSLKVLCCSWKDQRTGSRDVTHGRDLGWVAWLFWPWTPGCEQWPRMLVQGPEAGDWQKGPGDLWEALGGSSIRQHVIGAPNPYALTRGPRTVFTSDFSHHFWALVANLNSFLATNTELSAPCSDTLHVDTERTPALLSDVVLCLLKELIILWKLSWGVSPSRLLLQMYLLISQLSGKPSPFLIRCCLKIWADHLNKQYSSNCPSSRIVNPILYFC